MPLWLSWIVLGLVAGALAKFLVPGRDPSGCLVTIVLGIAGALVGGFIASLVGWGGALRPELDVRSLLLATLGAALLLVIGRLVRKR